jgi:hypothetical protein
VASGSTSCAEAEKTRALATTTRAQRPVKRAFRIDLLIGDRVAAHLKQGPVVSLGATRLAGGHDVAAEALQILEKWCHERCPEL